jgi:hypothetical protein
VLVFFVFFFNDTATTEIYTILHTLSLHDALHEGITQLVTEPQEVSSRIGPWPRIGLYVDGDHPPFTDLCKQVDFGSPRLPVCSRCRHQLHLRWRRASHSRGDGAGPRGSIPCQLARRVA